jgi:hypothetical protein
LDSHEFTADGGRQSDGLFFFVKTCFSPINFFWESRNQYFILTPFIGSKKKNTKSNLTINIFFLETSQAYFYKKRQAFFEKRQMRHDLLIADLYFKSVNHFFNSLSIELTEQLLKSPLSCVFHFLFISADGK